MKSSNLKSTSTIFQYQQKLKTVTRRFSRQNISKQLKLIANMNPKLQFTLAVLLKYYEEFKNLSIENVMKIITKIPYFLFVNKNEENNANSNIRQNVQKIISKHNNHHSNNINNKLNQKNPPPTHSNSTYFNILTQKQILQLIFTNQIKPQQIKLKLHYEDMQKIVILTGIKKSFMQQALRQFNYINNHNTHSHNHNTHSHGHVHGYNHNNHLHTHNYNNSYNNAKKCQIIGINQFWIAVQADTALNAYNFKKFVRNKKKNLDQKNIFNYKQQKKRVRIVMQNDNFYTLLVDEMTQKKQHIYYNSMIQQQETHNSAYVFFTQKAAFSLT